MRVRSIVVLAALAMGGTGAHGARAEKQAVRHAAAQSSPWTLTVTPTMNPLPVGSCAAVHVTVVDANGREPPRNPLGYRITIADFDMSVVAPDGVVAGQQIDRSR